MVEHDERVDEITVDEIRPACERVTQRAADFAGNLDNTAHTAHADAGVVDAIEGPAAQQREQVHDFRVQSRVRHGDVGDFRCRRCHHPRYHIPFTPLLRCMLGGVSTDVESVVPASRVVMATAARSAPHITAAARSSTRVFRRAPTCAGSLYSEDRIAFIVTIAAAPPNATSVSRGSAHCESDIRTLWPGACPASPPIGTIGAMTSRAVSGTDSRLAARAAATASLGAAVIHFAVTPSHWESWLPSGVFFRLDCGVSTDLGVARLEPPPRPCFFAVGGIMANAGFAALWVWSLTMGEPFGPNAGQPEAVHAAGICALLLECYIVMGAAWAWFRGDRAEPVSSFGSALILLGAHTVVAVAVTAGVASGLQGHDHHHGSDEAQGEHQAPPHSEHADGHHDQSEPAVPMDVQVTRPATAPPLPGPALPQMEAPHDAGGGAHHHD